MQEKSLQGPSYNGYSFYKSTIQLNFFEELPMNRAELVEALAKQTSTSKADIYKCKKNSK